MTEKQISFEEVQELASKFWNALETELDDQDLRIVSMSILLMYLQALAYMEASSADVVGLLRSGALMYPAIKDDVMRAKLNMVDENPIASIFTIGRDQNGQSKQV